MKRTVEATVYMTTGEKICVYRDLEQHATVLGFINEIKEGKVIFPDVSEPNVWINPNQIVYITIKEVGDNQE